MYVKFWVLILSLLGSSIAQASSLFDWFNDGSELTTENTLVQLKVERTYIDLYTGPSYGFPRHYSAKSGEVLSIKRRRTSWYKVITDSGVEGWVEEDQLAGLKVLNGRGEDFQKAVLDDFHNSRLEMSVLAGGLSDDFQFNVRLGWKVSEFIEIEGLAGKSFSDFSDSTFYAIGIQGKPLRGRWFSFDWTQDTWLDQPWLNENIYASALLDSRRWEPYVGLALGRLENDPNDTVIGAQVTEDDITLAQLGARYYITRNFVFRAEYARMLLHVDDDRRDDLDMLSFGIGAFF